MTVHPLGGCPLADSSDEGVVDQFQRVHGYHGLLVTDGAAVPSALGVNPSKTIAALAERSVEKLIGTALRDPAPPVAALLSARSLSASSALHDATGVAQPHR